MRITLINCSPKLAVDGIYMEQVGAFDKLYNEMIQRLPLVGLEYDFLSDSILIDADEGTIIPDLSNFGEVLPNDNSMG